MRELYYKNKFIVFLGLVIIAFIMHTWVFKLEFKLFIETLLFSFVAFVFFDWMANVTTKKELLQNLSKIIKNDDENIKMGFERVILGDQNINYEDLIQKSNNIYMPSLWQKMAKSI